jgi:UDP-glucose 4-epimerase
MGKINDFAIYGDDYTTPDGTAVRDYIHVAGLARAHLLALQSLLWQRWRVLQSRDRTGYSVRQILSMVFSEVGRTLPVVVKPCRSGDPAFLVANLQRARMVLGFGPAFSDLATIIGSAWKWHQQADDEVHRARDGSLA